VVHPAVLKVSQTIRVFWKSLMPLTITQAAVTLTIGVELMSEFS